MRFCYFKPFFLCALGTALLMGCAADHFGRYLNQTPEQSRANFANVNVICMAISETAVLQATGQQLISKQAIGLNSPCRGLLKNGQWFDIFYYRLNTDKHLVTFALPVDCYDEQNKRGNVYSKEHRPFCSSIHASKIFQIESAPRFGLSKSAMKPLLEGVVANLSAQILP